MLRFGLDNIRRLRHVPPIEIRPITLLVGKNSSGKSTFLRMFPLLRQSLTTRTSSPILWYGDLVDFGTFKSVISDGEEESMSLSFGVDEYAISARTHPLEYRYQPRRRAKQPVDVKLTISGDDEKTSLSQMSFVYQAGDVHFDLFLNADGDLKRIDLNGEDVSSVFETSNVSFHQGSILPEMLIQPKVKENKRLYYDYFDIFVSQFVNIIRSQVNRRIGDQQIHALAFNFFEMPDLSDASWQFLSSQVNVKGLRTIIEHMRSKNPPKYKRRIEILYYVCQLIKMIPDLFSELRVILSTTLYIGPMRARSERYYRYQDLAVSEIDPDGKNFPMFLNSLSAELRENFSQWVADRFGYGVEVAPLSGHISINLKVGTYVTNIVDNGYGISQILPVLGQIWWASRAAHLRLPPSRVPRSILVIEQPELHLHPAHQALIADAIVGERNVDDLASKVQFIIETHSEVLVNRLGELVALGKIGHEDLQILIFEGDDEFAERVTKVRLARFDEEGTLSNWPYGFFEPSV